MGSCHVVGPPENLWYFSVKTQFMSGNVFRNNNKVSIHPSPVSYVPAQTAQPRPNSPVLVNENETGYVITHSAANKHKRSVCRSMCTDMVSSSLKYCRHAAAATSRTSKSIINKTSIDVLRSNVWYSNQGNVSILQTSNACCSAYVCPSNPIITSLTKPFNLAWHCQT